MIKTNNLVATGNPPTEAGPVTYEGRDLEAMAALNRYYRWILESFRPHLRGRGVEFGAGRGAMSELLVPYLEHLDLIEPSPNLVAILKARFSDDPRVDIFDATIERYVAAVTTGNGHYDVAIMVNVLEHIEDDASALGGIRQSLKPGGNLLLFVPALMGLYSRFDAMVGHHRRYHLRELRELVATAGFEVERACYCDLLGVGPWFLMNRLLGKTQLDPTLVRIYDAIGTPATRLIEKVISPPFGKNIILTARKPEAAT